AVVLVERQVVLAPEHALLADDRLQLVDQRGPGWADGWRRHASPSRGARRQVYPSGPGRLGRGRSNEARRRGARRGQRRPRRRGRGAPPPTMRTTSSTSPSAIWTSSKRARLTISPLRSTATMRGSTPSAWRKPSTEQGPAISRGDGGALARGPALLHGSDKSAGGRLGIGRGEDGADRGDAVRAGPHDVSRVARADAADAEEPAGHPRAGGADQREAPGRDAGVTGGGEDRAEQQVVHPVPHHGRRLARGVDRAAQEQARGERARHAGR